MDPIDGRRGLIIDNHCTHSAIFFFTPYVSNVVCKALVPNLSFFGDVESAMLLYKIR